MKNVLKIQASLFGVNGQSSQLADHFIDDLRRAHGELRLVTRDLVTNPVSPLTLERFQALNTSPQERTPWQQAVVDASDALIAELQDADVIVFAVPMYNFNIPAALQNYFDHVARAGVTFHYTENGPEGLIKNKRTAVFVTRGGSYGGGDHSQTVFLRQFLSFIGLDDASYFHAEGLAVSDESREKSLAAVHQAITQATRRPASAA